MPSLLPPTANTGCIYICELLHVRTSWAQSSAGLRLCVVATAFNSPVAEMGFSPGSITLSANQRSELQKRCSLEGEQLWRGKEGFLGSWTEGVAGDSVSSHSKDRSTFPCVNKLHRYIVGKYFC